jgi:hypothetical protein
MARKPISLVRSRGALASFLYRGVHARHPALSAALEGNVVPGDPQGAVTPEEHNLGGVSANSPFTSWTTRLEIARMYALSSGPGGVVLRLPAGVPLPEESWSWELSPDEYHEDEVLLRGSRSGATVIMS